MLCGTGDKETNPRLSRMGGNEELSINERNFIIGMS